MIKAKKYELLHERIIFSSHTINMQILDPISAAQTAAQLTKDGNLHALLLLILSIISWHNDLTLGSQTSMLLSSIAAMAFMLGLKHGSSCKQQSATFMALPICTLSIFFSILGSILIHHIAFPCVFSMPPLDSRRWF